MNDAIATIILVVFIALLIWCAGYSMGLDAGWEDVASGSVICELTPLKEEWECMEKSNE